VQTDDWRFFYLVKWVGIIEDEELCGERQNYTFTFHFVSETVRHREIINGLDNGNCRAFGGSNMFTKLKLK